MRGKDAAGIVKGIGTNVSVAITLRQPLDPRALRVYLSAVEGRWSGSDAARELFGPRAQSHGPRPDIPEDADGVARLAELEAAQGAGSASPVSDRVEIADESATPPSPVVDPGAAASAKEGWSRSLWRRATATRLRRVAWGVGSLVGVGAVVATVVLLSVPRPDATLPRTAAEADDQVLRLVRDELSLLEIDGSTLRAYESYLGLELWSGENAFDSPCLMAVERSKDAVSEATCAPPEADLFIDVSSSGDSFDGHPGDGIVRFILRGDRVDAYIYSLPEDD